MPVVWAGAREARGGEVMWVLTESTRDADCHWHAWLVGVYASRDGAIGVAKSRRLAVKRANQEYTEQGGVFEICAWDDDGCDPRDVRWSVFEVTVDRLEVVHLGEWIERDTDGVVR